jgi:hypothetical protein
MIALYVCACREGELACRGLGADLETTKEGLERVAELGDERQMRRTSVRSRATRVCMEEVVTRLIKCKAFWRLFKNVRRSWQREKSGCGVHIAINWDVLGLG